MRTLPSTQRSREGKTAFIRCGGVGDWITYDGPETLRQELTRRLDSPLIFYRNQKPRRAVAYFRSGSRQFWFTWFRKGRHLGVSVRRIKTKRFSVPRDPAVEALAAQLQRNRTCPRCGKVFERTGRQRFCSEGCGTAWRVARFRFRRKAEARSEAQLADLQARTVAEEAEIARPETQRAMRQQAIEDNARGRKVLKAIYKAEAQRLRAGRS